MKKTYIITVVLFFGLVIAGIITAGARIGVFLSIPCFIIVVGLTFVLLLGSFSLREMGRSFAAGFSSGVSDMEVLKKGYEFFRAMQNYFLLSGLVGTMIGLIAVLALLDDVSKIGTAMALTLMTLFYGILFTVIIALPFKTGIRNRIIELKSRQ